MCSCSITANVLGGYNATKDELLQMKDAMQKYVQPVQYGVVVTRFKISKPRGDWSVFECYASRPNRWTLNSPEIKLKKLNIPLVRVKSGP